LKRASAGRVTAVIPYFGYGRTDKKDQPRVPITARLVAKLVGVSGADRVLTLDLHAGQIQGFFDVPVDEMSAMGLCAGYFAGRNLPQPVVVSPDLGNTKRARNFAEIVDAPLAIIEKRRIGNIDRSEVLNLIGSVENRSVIIVDDEIDTAGSIVHAAEVCLAHGASAVYASAIHPVLSGPAVERLAASPIAEVVVTNSIAVPPEKRIPKLTVLSVAPPPRRDHPKDPHRRQRLRRLPRRRGDRQPVTWQTDRGGAGLGGAGSGEGSGAGTAAATLRPPGRWLPPRRGRAPVSRHRPGTEVRASTMDRGGPGNGDRGGSGLPRRATASEARGSG
jgi:ribose-phosphate pyrophosphokinase